MCPLEAYLITDERIARHAAKYAHGRPQLAVGGPDTPLTAPGSPQTAGDGPGDWVDVAPMGRKPRCGPAAAGQAGRCAITDLMTACGMGPQLGV